MLELTDVSKHYGGIKAVDKVSFKVYPNEVVGLIGPNGSGKTTMMDLISGHTPLTSGHIVFNGQDITRHNATKIARAGIRRTFQTTSLFKDCTVLENLSIASHLEDKRSLFNVTTRKQSQLNIEHKSLELLEFVGIDSAYADRSVSELSTADQRRLMVAMAMVGDPAFILLDEPSAGMIVGERDDFQHLLLKIKNRGISILIVEHHMRLLSKICDRMVVLNFGKVIADDKPEIVQRDPVVVEAYLGRGSAAHAYG
ncbi:ABC transporter ATP-binding protein [Paenibacillus validus]|uniref:ABC transporter ATP-binding protein n=1 Tax=Paenibacillus validus TaxID=44253 RepID=UPI000FDA3A11|nr:ABC transporter ATP-binding protein [Paenibacillus validus]MED4599967.1 ABC transporter ATP-binding protein [Paenibacillus validus]MED4605861.1 ABC transporter ATP-binding protein [Paenibacillus validus]